MARIYTRTGDDGTTGLTDGTRLPKTDDRVTAIGDVDELNSWLGRVVSELSRESAVRKPLVQIQGRLFEIGAELAAPGSVRTRPEHVVEVEALIDGFSEKLTSLESFILPGGAPPAASCHVARAVCRRAERSVRALESVSSTPIYLNRLSDLLFVAARLINREQRYGETHWTAETQED